MNTRTIFVSSCRSCPFFGKSMDGMECRHPSFHGTYDNMIISQDNVNTIPEKCPLRNGEFTTTVRIGNVSAP